VSVDQTAQSIERDRERESRYASHALVELRRFKILPFGVHSAVLLDVSLGGFKIEFTGEINAKPGERIVFIGDCAEFKGTVAGKPIAIESLYVDRSKKTPDNAKAPDAFVKMAEVNLQFLKRRNDDVLRIAGCPVSVSEQVLALVRLGNLRDPFLDRSQATAFVSAYFKRATMTMIQRSLGVPYQVAGATQRGAARPDQNRAPEGAKRHLERA
jgi:hypothetical protein